MRMHNRLRRLERTVGDAGCPACRDRRGLAALVTCRRMPDGGTTEPKSRPVPCARCGEIPEKVIEVVIESREDLERQAGPPAEGGIAVNPRARLRRLEGLAPAVPDCPACRHKSRVAFVESQRQPDGTVTPLGGGPPRCETCGRGPEITIEVVRPVTESTP